MPAPKKNEFWKARATHGREKLFETPEALWEAACEYFQWCEDNPLFCSEWKQGADGKFGLQQIPKMRAYTMQGLCLFLHCNTSYFRNFKLQLKKEDKNFEGFSAVITDIEETVYSQKFQGAASGFLNANIIARDLGLTDQQRINGQITHVNSAPLTKEEIKDISKDFDNEL